MEPLRVLVVDGDESTRLETARSIEAGIEGTVETASSCETAVALIEDEPPTVLVTGYTLPDGNGLELARSLREHSPGSGCILYTRSEDIETETFEDLVVDFVPKEAPDAIETLQALIEQTGIEQSQAAHPIPEREQDRLEAASAVATGSETGPFERVARLAAMYFDAEAAGIVVVHRDELEVLAAVGPDMTPQYREQSLAAYTLTAEQQVLGVEDTRIDPRFSDVNAIHEAGIVSYLGATIRDPDGDTPAVLSVYDTEPSVFDAVDREYLGTLAAVAGDLLALTEGDDA